MHMSDMTPQSSQIWQGINVLCLISSNEVHARGSQTQRPRSQMMICAETDMPTKMVGELLCTLPLAKKPKSKLTTDTNDVSGIAKVNI